MAVAKILTILIYLKICAHSLTDDLFAIDSFDESDDLLLKCIMNIIETNFIYKPTVLVTDNQEENNTTNVFHERLTARLIKDLIPRIVDDSVNITSIYLQDGFTMFIKYFNDCVNIPSLMKETIDTRIKYLVVIFDFSKENCAEIFEVVGKNMSRYDITYVIRMQDEDFSISTFIPQMNATTCAVQYNIPVTFLSTCRSEEEFNSFPSKKPQDLMKCPYKVGMASLFPFTKITNRTTLKTLDPLYENEGLDFELMKIMAEYFNFTLEFYYINRTEENPYMVTEFLDFLLNGTFDACAGGLYNIFGDAVDYSGVYGRQTITWMYPVSRVTRSWQNLVTKVNGLYIFMIFYVCYSIIWYLVCRYDKKAVSINNMLLHTWGALIGTSSLLDAISLKQKILNIVYLVMCMHLSAYISIQMYSFLTIVGPPTIYKTNTELVESGLKPYLVALTKYFVTDKAYEAFANTSADCNSFTHCEEMCLIHNGVTVVIDGLFTLLQAETAVNDEARTLRVTENILTVYHEILLRKEGIINMNFQMMMRRLGDAGILNRLYDEAVGIATVARAQSAAKNIMSFSYSCKLGCSITMVQSAGAFYLWLFGCGISFCAFIVELMMKRERVTMRTADVYSN